MEKSMSASISDLDFITLIQHRIGEVEDLRHRRYIIYKWMDKLCRFLSICLGVVFNYYITDFYWNAGLGVLVFLIDALVGNLFQNQIVYYSQRSQYLAAIDNELQKHARYNTAVCNFGTPKMRSKYLATLQQLHDDVNLKNSLLIK